MHKYYVSICKNMWMSWILQCCWASQRNLFIKIQCEGWAMQVQTSSRQERGRRENSVLQRLQTGLLKMLLCLGFENWQFRAPASTGSAFMCMPQSSWSRNIFRRVSTILKILRMPLGAVMLLPSNNDQGSGYVQLCRLGSAVCAEALLGALQFVHSVHQGAA